MHKILFAGPTVAAAGGPEVAAAAGFDVRPPVKRGDLDMIATGEPGLVVVADGLFHQSLAVGHAELRRLLASGWRVWGLGSMGAIRAFEMSSFGMVGYGKVYGHFLADEDFQDDEVALLHTPGPEFVSVTEPLIHIRYFLKYLEQRGALRAAEAQRVIDTLKTRWYGDRNLDAVVALVLEIGGRSAAQATQLELSDFGRFRVKGHDLMAFLRTSPWLQGRYDETPSLAPYREAFRVQR